VRYRRREKNGGEQAPVTPSPPKAGERQTIPFVQRFTCTIDEACEATGLGRTKLYERDYIFARVFLQALILRTRPCALNRSSSSAHHRIIRTRSCQNSAAWV
jgi:hypothetical protein